MKDQKKPECNVALSFVFNYFEIVYVGKQLGDLGYFHLQQSLSGRGSVAKGQQLQSNCYRALAHQVEGNAAS